MSMQALRERLSAINKDANHLLAEKGSATWSKEDQAKFDGLMDEADRAQAQIAAHQRVLDMEAEKKFKDVPLVDKDKPQSEARKGVEIFLRKMSNELTMEERTIIRNTMSTTTGSQGGFTVQTLVAKEVVDAMKDYGCMRRCADSITTGNGADLSYPTSDGTSEIGEIVAQNATAATADPVFGTVALNTFKFGSKTIAIPIELLQDTNIDVVALIKKRIRDRIGRLGNQKFTVGSGTGEPNGIVTAASVGKTGTTGQTLTIIYDDLVDLVDSLDVAYQNDACCFMMSQTMRRVVRKIKDTTGRPIWTPSYEAGMAATTPDLLMGYPVQINNDLAVPAANAKSLGFGDASKYMIRDAMEVTIFRFEDSAFLTKGQVGFLAWARQGGNLLDTNAFKVYQHSAT